MTAFAVMLAVVWTGLPVRGATDDAGTVLARLGHDYLYGMWRSTPSWATEVGEHRFDAMVDDLSAAGFRDRLALDRRTLAALRDLDPGALSPEAQIDRRILEDTAQEDLLINDRLAQWKHDPDLVTGTAASLINDLIKRDFAPLAQRMRSAIARERGIPRLLQQADANITTVDATTKQIALVDAAGTPDFFAGDVPAAFAAVHDAALQAAFRTANAAVVAAFRRHAAFLRRIVPHGTFAIGADAYLARVGYEDGLTISLADYRAVGERALAATRAQFVATSRRIDPSRTPAQNFAAIRRVHPPATGIRAAAQHDLVRLRAFLIARDLVTLPPDADVVVRDTPPFERAFVTAEMQQPGPLDSRRLRTFYYVTPVDRAWPARRQEEFLTQFSDFIRPIVSAHEIYPGHFVNFTTNREHQLSLIRNVLWSSEFAEGWAHYSEQLVVDEGWGNGDPRVRLAQLSEALLRNCRYVAGVQLHTAGWTVPQAEKFFTTTCFMNDATAEEEALRGTQDPLYGYYTLGKLMILKLRDDYRRKLGAGFSLKAFHDALLAHGDAPIPYLRPLLLGADDDGRPLPPG